MSDKFRIDNHKLIFHPERVAQWVKGHKEWETAKSIYPIYMEISPVGYCNHRCCFCAKDYIGYQNRKIPFDVLKARLIEMAELGVKSVMFAGEGESTLYKELPELVKHCTDIGIDTSLTTNMVPFTSQSTPVFVEHCKWIKVSFNGGNSEVYAKIHGTKEEDFHRVVNTLKSAVEIRKEKGFDCTLGAQMLLLPDNVDTAIEFVALMKEIGLDYAVIKPYSQHLLSNTMKYKEIDYSKLIHIDNELEKYNTDDFSVIFRKHTMEKMIKHEGRYNKCGAVPFFWGYIMADGNVYGCSSFLGEDLFCYGNINEQGFKQIWESEERKKCFEHTKDVMDSHECRENCRMDEINRYLWELDHPGPHVNFI